MGLRTKAAIWISGVMLSFFAGRELGGTAAIVVAMGHVIIYMLHSVEVRINKLLDHHDIYVSQKEIDE